MYLPENSDMHVCVDNSVKQHYRGPQDEEGQYSCGKGLVTHNQADYIQRYEGNFLWNNMHGYGKYEWELSGEKYEGQMYANEKEGYGTMSYPSGARFEGLFRNDQRFGPGVYTDVAGYQDVGIWQNAKLIRLARILSSDLAIPSLARSDEDTRVLRYRRILDLSKNKVEKVAINMLESLRHSRYFDDRVFARAEELYNSQCRDDRALWFNRTRYEAVFFGNVEKSSGHIPAAKKHAEEEINTGNFEMKANEEFDKRISDDTNDETRTDYYRNRQSNGKTVSHTFSEVIYEDGPNMLQSLEPTTRDYDSVKSNINKSDMSAAKNNEFEKRITAIVETSSFMAWNNNPLMIDVQKHVFRHRKFEKELSFDVKQILAGRRDSFREEGTREKANMEFLIACSNGIASKIVDLIYSRNLDVDVADNSGNTSLFFAAVNDRLDAIDILLDFGADVDGTNDECLTPLGLSVLRLLALIHNVTDWSSSFLPPDSWIQTNPMTRDMAQQSTYNDTDSSTDQASKMLTKNPEPAGSLKSKVSSKNINSQISEKQHFVFNFTPTQLRKDEANGNNVNSQRRRNGTTSNKLEKLDNNVEKREKIDATILKLLCRGADPNVANVPYPVLIMAMFSKSPSLVRALLEHGADPNVSLSKENYHLTPLLILAGSRPSQENTLMAKALLNSKANPSSRADSDYCQELIMGHVKSNQSPEFLETSQGLTALHLLALNAGKNTAEENKHLSELIKTIYRYGHFKQSDLHQGHSPLSLAILKGNLTAGKAILETGCVNVNEQLGPDFGNAMLMMESCWLKKLLTPVMIKKCLELLVEYGGCPLASAKVSEVEYNQVEYGRMELGKMLKEVGNGMKKYRKSRIEASRVADFNKSMDFVESIAREQLNEHVMRNCVKNLPIATTNRSRKKIVDERVFRQARRWTNEKDLFNAIKTMNYSQDEIKKLVNILSKSNLSMRQESATTSQMKKKRETMPIKLARKMGSQICTDFREAIDVQSDDVNNHPSDINDSREFNRGTDVFKVCYNCFTTHGKMLILCPECELVYFCSEECNVRNTAQIKNPHQCPVFYNNVKLRLETSAGIRGDIDPSSCMIKKFHDTKSNTNSHQYNEEYIIQNGVKNFRKSRRNINVGNHEIGQIKLTKNSALDKNIDKNESSAEFKIGNDCINPKPDSKRMTFRNCENNEVEGSMDLQSRTMTTSDSDNNQTKDKNLLKWNELSIKNVDWLLRVKKCSDVRLDFDTVLLPCTGFVQGDSYYRILPANEDHKITDNYSFV